MYTVTVSEIGAAAGTGYANEGPIGLLLTDTNVLKRHCANLRPLRRFYEHRYAGPPNTAVLISIGLDRVN